tara:strand:+ start:485 stop:715 length:231 start_codon:yes stop_codon:yes gene_type:complete
MKIVSEAESRWRHVQSSISILMQAFNPQLERIFDVDYLSHNNSCAVKRNWKPESSFDQSIKDIDSVSVQDWWRQFF